MLWCRMCHVWRRCIMSFAIFVPQESVQYLEEHADELSDSEDEDSSAMSADSRSSNGGGGSTASATWQSGAGPLPA